MNLSKKLIPYAVAAAVAAPTLLGMTAAHADTSASFAASTMYLWRGINLTPDGGAISGSLDYAHDSGFYAGIWGSTETGGEEVDLYAGYGGSVGDFGYDISYWKYLYPEDCALVGTGCGLGDNSLAEYVVSGSFKDFSVAAYINAESSIEDYVYWTVGYDYDKFNLTYGFWDTDTVGDNEYSHLTLTYAATDELSFYLSKASNDSGYTEATGVATDPLFGVTYSKSFDL